MGKIAISKQKIEKIEKLLSPFLVNLDGVNTVNDLNEALSEIEDNTWPISIFVEIKKDITEILRSKDEK